MVFRTQSAALIEAMTGFFRLWKYVEDKFLAPQLSESLDYALYDGSSSAASPCREAETARRRTWPRRSPSISSSSTGS